MASTMNEQPVHCGDTIHGFYCDLPHGHNMGQVDLPEKHRPAHSLATTHMSVIDAARKLVRATSGSEAAEAVDEIRAAITEYDAVLDATVKALERGR